MPSPRRRRVLRALPVAAVLLVASTACAPGGQPTGYGPEYRENFIFGCTGVELQDLRDGAEPKLASRQFCECYYDELRDRVSFDQAREFEEQQAQADSGRDIEVPRRIQAAINACSDTTDPEPS